MGCTDLLRRGVGAPHQCSLGSEASYLCHFMLTCARSDDSSSRRRPRGGQHNHQGTNRGRTTASRLARPSVQLENQDPCRGSTRFWNRRPLKLGCSLGGGVLPKVAAVLEEVQSQPDGCITTSTCGLAGGALQTQSLQTRSRLSRPHLSCCQGRRCSPTLVPKSTTAKQTWKTVLRFQMATAC